MTTPATDAATLAVSRSQLLGTVGRCVRDPRISTGALASLRRGDRMVVARQAAFFAVLADVPEHHLAPASIPRWAAVVQCMAITGVPADTKIRDGSALARSGLTESRFARLLASRSDGFFDQLLLLARYLNSKEVSIGWRELGELALTVERKEERADEIRLSLARDFYRPRASSSMP
jgi:CRISPR type I-E-associated protein CasB/Cse2